ncbi:hypothetical protein PhiCh1p89 [Natrialba phage PhiCh1]|uniref:Virus protein phiCh1-VP88 n=2 Tax=root TaxID=1 RepID=D3T2E0_NATMM|nr:hypothetical protein [Natrialba magadii]NP_666006.1 hypothetical protein PhiCh1p89 [Natrialba phage PhiCh1]YP_010078115.1 uncharacterized protein KMC42_gp85 [Natrialba phage PhiCh1]AAM88762.1 unknown [Natrialba phage PhiCh1]ADD07749.1 virus protein phiCh1-VP88 [Natrialba magadii ATCC 43099]ELY22996.1 hypothetical protein C500_21070 [Natrialba magadii ATCC 43099]QBJ01266.1 uncharacterized protein PhiCh1_420 [Natrialba phage PhiCh1]
MTDPSVFVRRDWKQHVESHRRVIYERAVVDGDEIGPGDVLATSREYVDPAIAGSVHVFEVDCVVYSADRYKIRPSSGGYQLLEDLVEMPEWVPADLLVGRRLPADVIQYVDGEVVVR